jgi:hypothetical protein
MTPSNRKSHTFLGLPRLPNRYAWLIMPFLLSVFMTCVVSVISTVRGVGFNERFFQLWPGAWALSWLIAFPTLLFVLPCPQTYSCDRGI